MRPEIETRSTRNQNHRPRAAAFTSIPLVKLLGVKTSISIVIATITTIASGILTAQGAPSVPRFLTSTVALAALASIVGDGTEQLGSRLGPGATGILQSALGNLPELFISIFALQKGLVAVVQAALVGSILANDLLVLGTAFLVGGLRWGTQYFDCEPPKLISLMTLIAVAAVAVPTATAQFHTKAAGHEETLSVAVAIVLLILFVASLFFVLRGGRMDVTTSEGDEQPQWPTWLAVAVLAVAGVAAAFVSDWFVQALEPATKSLGISAAFTGLVIVALAGNAVENVVGVQFAARNQADLAVSVILNSSLQVALALVPALVLLSFVVSSHHLTLVLSPLLVLALLLTALVTTIITYDGESTWIEGLALIGLYVIIAASFWWG